VASSHFWMDGEKRLSGGKQWEHDFHEVVSFHGLFVDGMIHVPTSDALKKEFMEKYTRDFDITGGGLMETFLGMQVEQSKGRIRLHLDNYIQEILDEYKVFQTKSLHPMLVPIQPGLVLTKDDCPILPESRKQKFYRSFIAKLQFAMTWVRFDI
jgi:hypothetical protein